MFQAKCLSVSIPSLPPFESLDFNSVTNLGQFQILGLLGSGPVFSWENFIEQLYVSRIEMSPDATKWTFHFKEGLKFSDDSPLNAQDWYNSIRRTIRAGVGVHFNPKRDLIGGAESPDGTCEGLVLKENKVELALNAPNINLPRLVGKPDASILTHSVIEGASLKDAATSGPFSLSQYEPKNCCFIRNPNYPGFENSDFDSLEIKVLPDGDAISHAIGGKLDLYYPGIPFGMDARAKLTKAGTFQRLFGMTVFLSFRNRYSREWSDIRLRRTLAAVLNEFKEVSSEETRVLLQGPGLGRIFLERHKREVSIRTLPVLSLAIVDSPLNRNICDHLSNSGLKLEILLVSQFSELYENRAGNTDAILVSTDFSAPDAYVSFYNALNPDRALIPDDGSYRQMLADSQLVLTPEERDQKYKILHQTILSDAWTIPICAYWSEFFASQRVVVSGMKGFAWWKCKLRSGDFSQLRLDKGEQNNEQTKQGKARVGHSD